MTLKKTASFFASVFRVPQDSDYFREASFITTVLLTGIAAWVAVGQAVSAQLVSARSGLLLFGLIALTGWGVGRFLRQHYLRSLAIFLAGQLVFITALAGLLKDLNLGYIFLFTVVMSGSLLGPLGAFLTATLAVAAEVTLALSLPGQLHSAALLPVLILLQYLAALISAQVSQGLYSALEAAEILAREARSHAEEARQHRAELHRTLKSLDIAYAQLEHVNDELIQAREDADAALHFKKEFIAQTSHELRTPLNLIIGFSETMAFSQNSYNVKLPAAYLRDVTEIHRNSRHLLSLIDDILDLSKLESGRMGLRFNLVDIRDVFQEVVNTIQPLTHAKNLELILEIPDHLPPLWMDQARINQVLLNLLSNAARLTKTGRIVLRADHRAMQNDLLVEVQDTGPGISPDLLPHIFEEFSQARETAGAPGTTGLGLTISKRIVELHGGAMWVESEPGQGSRFFFTLPVYMPFSTAQASLLADFEQHRASQPAIVILSEDSLTENSLLTRHLDGYLLSQASSDLIARELIQKTHARAVITSRPFSPSLLDFPVPVISCPLPSAADIANSLGITFFLRKPLTIKTLREALKQAAPQAKSLLLIDEDPNALRLLERMTQGLGKATRAYSAAEALDLIRDHCPDAILLDLGISEGSGLDLVRQIKQNPSVAHVPILALSDLDMDDPIPDRPVAIYHPGGFTPAEMLNYVQGLLEVLPPAKVDRGTSVPPSPEAPPE
ncbi:MAG TPA: ATP-binding protein [Anaerolineaceae bacterium]|nr:ATP-binding protein [Anaerolineaceae bacterium]HPN54254.1 ATP-binding protein [Anaerolineaceae bacterium]